MHFIAIDANGLASAIVSRSFEKKSVISATGTLAQHFVAHRITIDQFIKLGGEVGFTAVVTLFLINDKWVLNPETQEVSASAPVVNVSVEYGIHTNPIAVVIKARHDVDAAPKIYYTLDGSIPTESALCFTSSGLINLDTPGAKTIKYRARDAFGNWSDVGEKTYTMNTQEVGPKIRADKPNGEYSQSFDVVISASDDVDDKVTVYYTTNGSDPSDAKNPDRDSFVDNATFAIEGNGNHPIWCYAQDSAGNETLQVFAWRIDDQAYPETSLSPGMGGVYVGSVDVALSSPEKCEWTKYTIDKSEPSDMNGIEYAGPIKLDETTVLKFRSKDASGNLEPVKTATFTIVSALQEAIFNNSDEKDGYTKAAADGGDAYVGSFDNLAVGMDKDGKENRAILHFDTSSLPDNVEIASARLELKVHSAMGDSGGNGDRLEIDVQRGYFGSSQAVQADDWGTPATAEKVAYMDLSATDVLRSTDFPQAGIDAINKTGATQVRLRMSGADALSANHCLFIKGGAATRLLVEYKPRTI